MEVHKDSFARMLNYVCSLTLNSIRFMSKMYDQNLPDDFLRPMVVILASPLLGPGSGCQAGPWRQVSGPESHPVHRVLGPKFGSSHIQ